MKKLLFGLWITATLLLPAQALDMIATLKVGKTGISCYQLPCPWRGIVAGERQGAGFQRPLWWGDILPTLDASAGDTLRLTQAWDEFECLLVDGAFDGTTLKIRAILGPCP